MHIIIGIISAIAGLIWALHSLQNAGVDLNALNPFTWARRRKWAKQLGVKPMHALKNSMEAAALLVVSIAKSEGEITRDTKMNILEIFEEQFGIKRNASIELFSSSAYMLQDTVNMEQEVRHVLAPSKDSYKPNHIQTLLDMMHKVASLEGEASQTQQAIIDAVKNELTMDTEQPSKW